MMKVVVFQEQSSGERKLAGLKHYGQRHEIVRVVDIDGPLPDFIDEPEEWIGDEVDLGGGELVLNFLKHPDLVDHLIAHCEKRHIPIVSAGRKGGGFTPFTCCGLGRHEQLGEYGRQFGLPEYRVRVDEGLIREIEVLRGAPCGASWLAIDECIGVSVSEALTRLPRLVQYHCSADPSGFDPVSGKSPVHYAGYVHIAALKKALEEAGKEQ